MPGRAELNATSFALLALLAARPWTTYELARQVQRSLGWYWPRATSVLYTEPKKLVRHGLAEASHAFDGRRPRTVYSITQAGRQALRNWLDTPGRGPTLEFEALVQVAFADQGDRDQLLRNLRAIRDAAETRRTEALERGREYVQTGGRFPDRLAVIALTGKLLLEQTELLVRWSAWAQAEVEIWPERAGIEGWHVPVGAFELGWPDLSSDQSLSTR
jgi:DNA-binding PadR family transcriptional regulator